MATIPSRVKRKGKKAPRVGGARWEAPRGARPPQDYCKGEAGEPSLGRDVGSLLLLALSCLPPVSVVCPPSLWGGNRGEGERVAPPWRQDPARMCGEMPFGDRI